MKFQPNTLDHHLSPYTGLTRESWLEAAKYLLDGIFKHIESKEHPVVMPRQETTISYPHLFASEEVQEAQRKAEMFEGLTRSFFIAAPLIANEPEVMCGEIELRTYYKEQVLRSCTKGDSLYIGIYEELQTLTGNRDPFCTFQQTVETCALVIGLWLSKEAIWDTYTQEEKDCIAAFLLGFAHSNTVPQNWRLFNMLDMAFLHREGYEIDQEIMLDHAQSILNYYVGDGWYRDGQSFDYYSCWAFNVYAPLWNDWYGYEHMPAIAKRFEDQSNELMKTYQDLFDEDGFTMMWGRSNIYRNATTSAFDGNLLLHHSTVNPGLARRISSGSLMQFLGREDFLTDGVPTLGFYGQFTPLIQGYSCAESPFWFGKAFLCLHLPEAHPFWTATEENGSWEVLQGQEVKETVLDGPALCITNHKANGETILRTGKVVKGSKDIPGMWNYSKLAFNSKYPWEATPTEDGVVHSEIESQQYVLKDCLTGKVERANVTLWCGSNCGVLYRRQFFDYTVDKETHWMQAMNLADIPVPYGILRIDKHRLHRRPVELTLGSYGFSNQGTNVEELIQEGAKAMVLTGYDATGQEKQMAMTIYDGWDDLTLIKSTGTNPDSLHSIVIYAKKRLEKQYGGAEPYVMISQVITKESHQPFTREELFPIREIVYEDSWQNGSYGTTKVILKNGSSYMVNFEGIEREFRL